MNPASSPLRDALAEAQGRLERNELRLPPYPGGEPGEVMVSAGDHILVIDPSSPCVRAVSRRAHERFSWWTRVARAGMSLIGIGWIMTLLAVPTGVSLLPGLMTAAAGLFVFAVPLAVCLRFPADPFVVCPAHPLSDRAASVLRAASRHTSERPPPAFAWELPRTSPAPSR